MASGLKITNSVVADGVSIEDHFGITHTAAAKLLIALPLSGPNGLIYFCISNEAITIADYNGLPVGSVVISPADAKMFVKITTTFGAGITIA